MTGNEEVRPETTPEEIKSADQLRIDRMDRVCAKLLDLVDDPNTSDTQKGRFVAQVQAWYKLRPTLIPASDGSKIQEMTNGLKATGGKRGGSTGRASPAARNRDGSAINAIIRSIKTHRGNADGNPPGAERPSGRPLGDGGQLRANGSGDVDRDVDGPGDVS